MIQEGRVERKKCLHPGPINTIPKLVKWKYTKSYRIDGVPHIQVSAVIHESTNKLTRHRIKSYPNATQKFK